MIKVFGVYKAPCFAKSRSGDVHENLSEKIVNFFKFAVRAFFKTPLLPAGLEPLQKPALKAGALTTKATAVCICCKRLYITLMLPK